MVPTFSVIIPTAGRDTLRRSLYSCQEQDLVSGDEILVVGDGPVPDAEKMVKKMGPPFRYIEGPLHHTYGSAQRNFALDFAKAEWISWMDDDDIFTPRAFEIIRSSMSEYPCYLFRFKSKLQGVLVWGSEGDVVIGNVGGHCIVARNTSELGRWNEGRYEGDYYFIKETLEKNGGQVGWVNRITAIQEPKRRLVAKRPNCFNDLESMRLIRNSCREFMTHNTSFITQEQQFQWWEYVKDQWTYLYLDLDDTPIGYGLVKKEENKMWVSGGLLPEYRGKGFGRELFEHLTWACEGDAWLEVKEDNLLARKTYVDLGYIELVTKDGIVTMACNGQPI